MDYVEDEDENDGSDMYMCHKIHRRNFDENCALLFSKKS